eukprot:gene11363-4531_t
MEDQKFDKVKDANAKRKRTTSTMLYLLVGSGTALYLVFMLTFVLGLIFSFVLLIPYYKEFSYVGINECYLENERDCINPPPLESCSYSLVAKTPQLGNITKNIFLKKTSVYQLPCKIQNCYYDATNVIATLTLSEPQRGPIYGFIVVMLILAIIFTIFLLIFMVITGMTGFYFVFL